MKRRVLGFALAAIVLGGASGLARASSAPPISADAPIAGVLRQYVERERAHFSWSEESAAGIPAALELLAPGASVRSLRVVSQQWQGADWVHRVLLVVPKDLREAALAHTAVLWISGSGKPEQVLALALPTAQLLGVPCAVLMDVPNQPLLANLDPKGKGFKEDALIATTLVQFQESGDPDWPLLLPMARSAVAAMDAIAAFSEAETLKNAAEWKWGKIEKFVVGGASKRGWTTWLTAAIDSRVAVILPAVYDNLNIKEQLVLQREQYKGGYSEKIKDYVSRGLFEMVDTPRGRQTLDLIDPWTYREDIKAPALMLLATNDEYWAAGGAARYIDGLKNPAFIHYVTNAGHSLGGGVPVVSIVAFVQAGMGLRPLPPSVRIEVTPSEVVATVRESLIQGPMAQQQAGSEVVAVRIWSAVSDDTDMRDEKWEQAAAQRCKEAGADGAQRYCLQRMPGDPSGSKRRAFAAEVTVRDSRGEYSIFSPMILSTD